MPPDDGEDAAMLLPRLQSTLKQFQSSGKAFHLIGTSTAPRRCRTLIILDSSFNPPTLAHMQMATTALQDIRTQGQGKGTSPGGDVDCRLLLLLAVNNADKAPKPAAFEHRLLMMHKFAGDIQKAWTATTQPNTTTTAKQGDDDDNNLPVDIGLTAHPFFHEKSASIATSPEYTFTSPSNPSTSSEPHTEQIFLAGFDTLIRIFNPKYYQPPVPEAAVINTPSAAGKKTPLQIALDPFFARARLRITMRADDDWGGKEDQLRYLERLIDGDELEKVGGRREWARRVEMVQGMVGSKEEAVVSSTLAREAVKAKDWTRLRKLVPEGVADLIERGEVSW
ncbi:hypothetical protein VP1G_00803 [Cytospora mali]|uniref:Nicotinamide-nucleotide adenylyltransferase n=1 Tax=Cytospora mali TaxID=578113 RepID=A0A194UNG3_CYTMA|nr:hypothetical protein VP1G_00803 [Valsa mali var. pyri (nom. inval.)]